MTYNDGNDMTPKETLVYMIKHKGNCQGINCHSTNCPMFRMCMGTRPVTTKWADWLYQQCIAYYIEKYGKDELVGELI